MIAILRETARAFSAALVARSLSLETGILVGRAGSDFARGVELGNKIREPVSAEVASLHRVRSAQGQPMRVRQESTEAH